MLLKYLMVGCLLLIPVGCTAFENAVPPGFMQGHLHIVSPKTVELADGNAPTVTAETYAEYPLSIFSQDGKKEIARRALPVIAIPAIAAVIAITTAPILRCRGRHRRQAGRDNGKPGPSRKTHLR